MGGSYSTAPIHLIKRPTRSTQKLQTGKFLRLLDQDPSALSFCDFALFLTSMQEFDRAERYFKRALACEPYDCRTLASFALFLEIIRHDYDACQKVYIVALETPRRKKKHASLMN